MFLADLPGFKNPLFLNFKKMFFLAHSNKPHVCKLTTLDHIVNFKRV